jgi:hypothetical protein
MKNTIKVRAIRRMVAIRRIAVIALLAAIAFSMAACDSGFGGGGDGGGGTDPRLNGTWVNEYQTMTFNNGNFEVRVGGDPMVKGTYYTTDSTLTITPTHFHGDLLSEGLEITFAPKWYSRAELRALEFFPEHTLVRLFTPETYQYSISGNTLYFTTLNQTTVYYRR